MAAPPLALQVETPRASRPATTHTYVVVPAYNEAAGISSLLEALRELDHSMPLSVVLVDDGSRDGTSEKARAFTDRFDLQIVTHDTNKGVPQTFFDGLAAAAHRATPDDAIILIEGDGTSDLALLPEMTRRIARGHDVVVGSRYVEGGGFVGFPFQRRAGSNFVNFVLSRLLPVPGVTDYTIFFRAYRAERIQQALAQHGDALLQTKSFAANMELLLRLLPFCTRFSEVPLRYDYGLKKSGSKMRPLATLLEYKDLIFARLMGRI